MPTSARCSRRSGGAPDARWRTAASTAAPTIEGACAADTVQAGLATSYNALADDTAISSCILSQHNASAAILLGEINGTPGQLSTNSLRVKCAATLNKVGIKQATGAHKILN